MTVLDELKRLAAAEDFFRVLGVPYDPQVLNVARLHILRRMGAYLADTAAQDEGDATRQREMCRAQLQRAYDDFTRSTPISERVFKVHKDAVRPAHSGFVGLSELTQPGDET